MQFSAVELLAEQRRAPGRSKPDIGDADTKAAAQSHVSTTTAEVAPRPAMLGAATASDSHGMAADYEMATRNSESQHAPAQLVHRLQGDYPAPLYDAEALQLWLLQCCQTVRRHLCTEPKFAVLTPCHPYVSPFNVVYPPMRSLHWSYHGEDPTLGRICAVQLKGGLRDKPGKAVDYYHTCYCLSGLSVSQHSSGIVLGPTVNLLAQTDVLCNVVNARLASAMEHFGNVER